MMDAEYSKITVNIYGQEYTVATTQSKERVLQIADHVDETIRGLAGQGANGSVAALSMLAAVNIAQELFSERDGQEDVSRERDQLQKDIAHYQQLWEEAKKTHLQYQEDQKSIQEQKDSLQERLGAKMLEIDNLTRKIEEQAALITRLEGELETEKARVRNASSYEGESQERIKELEAKIKEIEGNYFELQMENIQMKGDLERYRGGAA